MVITYTEKRFFEWHEDNVSVTLVNKGGSYGGGSEVFVVHNRFSNTKIEDIETAPTLDTSIRSTGGGLIAVMGPKCIGNGQANQLKLSENVGTLDCMHEQQAVMERQNTVRRLTPLECERLQGFPDGWTDIGEWTDTKGKKHKEADGPRYKALGNSIALPFWEWMAKRICALYGRPVTLGSLFDGIGGFPLVFERNGGKAVWASEIEEFPIAVTKRRFPEE